MSTAEYARIDSQVKSAKKYFIWSIFLVLASLASLCINIFSYDPSKGPVVVFGVAVALSVICLVFTTFVAFKAAHCLQEWLEIKKRYWEDQVTP